MNRISTLFSTTLFFLAAQISLAQDTATSTPSVSEQLTKITSLGPGVHSIQKDKRGRIMSCLVVGQSRVSTVLGKAKGLEVARDKANLDCSSQFVRWLKEEAKVYVSSDEETLVILEGAEGRDESSSETGKSIEKTGKKMESISNGLVRGLQVIHSEIDGDGKTLTIVKGWKASNVAGLKKMIADLATDSPAEKNRANPKLATGTSKSPKENDKTIESRTTTSDDAADFLPKR